MQATDSPLRNVPAVQGTDARLHGDIPVTSREGWGWSELDVKHNFVFIEGNHQHDGKARQQAQILQDELPHWTKAMFLVVTITMQHLWKLKQKRDC